MAVLGVLLWLQLAAPVALADLEQKPASLRYSTTALVSQRPDLRGCLLASTATVANLLRLQREDRLLTYHSVWLHYDRLNPGFASDPWAYPQPWSLGPLAEQIGLSAEAYRTYDSMQVEAWLTRGLYPIVYLGGSPTTPAHAVVILGQNAESVRYWDPWDGLRVAPRTTFYAALGPWATVLRSGNQPTERLRPH